MLPDKGNLSLSLHNYLLPLNNIHLVCLCGNDNLLIWTQFSLVFRTVSYELCASLNKAPDISASRKATDSLAVHVNSHHALMCVMHELKVSSQKVQLDIRKKKKAVMQWHSCPQRWWSPHPWRYSWAMGMWHLETWFRGHGGEGLGLDLKILKDFSNSTDSMKLQWAQFLSQIKETY